MTVSSEQKLLALEMLMVCLMAYSKQVMSWFRVFEWHRAIRDCHALLEAHMYSGWLAALHNKDTSGQV
jgi:hypothetical protein